MSQFTSRRGVVRVLAVVVMGRMLGNGLPALTIVELHPIILAILHLAAVLESLCEQVTKKVVVGSILKAKVADVAEVLVELVWRPSQYCIS